ncbi:MAG: hypothetical protein KKF77_07960 [Proteobacteria bacterium]|nr:hypothetical protein [Pseudomonadota bacterium]
MLGMLKSLEDTFAALAFADAGERQEAMQMAGVKEMSVSVSDVFAAVAFAEAGCEAEARDLLGIRPVRLMPTPKVCGFLESVGLSGVRVAYGLAEA